MEHRSCMCLGTGCMRRGRRTREGRTKEGQLGGYPGDHIHLLCLLRADSPYQRQSPANMSQDLR